MQVFFSPRITVRPGLLGVVRSSGWRQPQGTGCHSAFCRSGTGFVDAQPKRVL